MKRLSVCIACIIVSFMVGCANTSPVIYQSDNASSNSQSNEISLSGDVVSEDDATDWSATTKETWDKLDGAPAWLPDERPEFDDAFAEKFYEINNSWNSYDEISVKGEYSDIFPIITNETPLKLMLTEIDELYLYYCYASNFVSGFAPLPNRPHISGMLNQEYDPSTDAVSGRIPIGFLRQTDIGQYYTVCKLKDGGYIYYFFDQPIEEYRTGDETDVYLWGAIYAENAVSYNDFSGIAVGSPIEDVIAVDSAAKMTLAYYQYNRDVIGATATEYIYQIVLLTDGILEIKYEPKEKIPFEQYGMTYYSNKNDDLVVASIKYFSDGNYISDYCTEEWQEVTIPIQILPQDYPPAS